MYCFPLDQTERTGEKLLNENNRLWLLGIDQAENKMCGVFLVVCMSSCINHVCLREGDNSVFGERIHE